MDSELWNETYENLMQSLPDTKQHWIRNVSLAGYDDDSITLSFSSSFTLDNFKSNCLSEVENTISALTGKEMKINFVIEKKRREEKKEEKEETRILENIGKTGLKKKPVNDTLNPNYTFENYVVGDNNNFAYNAARVISARA